MLRFSKIIALKEDSRKLNWCLPKRDSIKELLPFWATMWIKINDSDQIIFNFVEKLKKERDEERKLKI